MKLVTAMVRSDMFEAVQEAVTSRDAQVTYVSEVGDVREAISANYRGSSYSQPRPRLRMDIVVVNDLIVDDVIDAICDAALMGDSDGAAGNIFVSPLDQWVRLPARRPQTVTELESVGASRRAS